MSKKRGQITIFIILGIIILLSIFLFIYFREAVTVFTPERVIPPELEPLDNFVGGCVNRIARDGLNILGANGGFIRFPDDIELDPGASLRTNPLFPSIKVPLWHFRGTTRVPSEDYMKEDLAYYIDQNLDECLDNLEAFQEQFEIIELEPRKVFVELTDRSVDVILDYRLEIRSLAENQTTRINEFRTSVPVRLKTVYELARKILDEEILEKFIEVRTIDLLALDDDIPYTGMEFTCTPKIWYIQDVKAKLKKLLRANLPMIRVDKTSYQPVPPDQQYVKTHYIWDVTDLKYPTTHVSFSYEESWPMEMYVRPNDGPILKSNAQRGFDLLSFMCIHMHHFTYDIRYPVLTTITDDQGKNHEKYTFSFAFEAGIDHNFPDNTNFGISEFNFEPRETSERFCLESVKNTLKIRTFENFTTLFGEEHNDLPGVNLTYTCIRLKCPVGQTEWQFRGQEASITKQVPFCVNGVLRGTKEGYKENYIFVSTDSEKTVDLYLTPIISKNITVVKHSVYGQRVGQEESLKDQSAIITIKKDRHKSTAVFPTEYQGVLSELEFLGKWDYTYNIEIFLVDEETTLGGGTISGGYKASWTIPWNKIKGAREIKFHVVEWPHVGEDDAEKFFEYMTNLEEMSQQVPSPEFTI
ncbi:hypothetical protein GOV06_02445 [Candidatus Woesearchaeota archaeon]|nr:hypothetical protein [Candidatus Woesearchaeota archaeon]